MKRGRLQFDICSMESVCLSTGTLSTTRGKVQKNLIRQFRFSFCSLEYEEIWRWVWKFNNLLGSSLLHRMAQPEKIRSSCITSIIFVYHVTVKVLAGRCRLLQEKAVLQHCQPLNPCLQIYELWRGVGASLLGAWQLKIVLLQSQESQLNWRDTILQESRRSSQILPVLSTI